MRSFLYAGLITFTSFVVITTQKTENLDKKVAYFTSTYFYCDSQAVNTSQIHNIESVSWLLPDNTILKNGQKTNRVSVSDSGYNLTINRVHDEVFGYYFCIIVLKQVNKTDIKSIQFGLNIDGADFSDLQDEYRKGAIVGGIAAGIMLALCGTGCLIWHFRSASKHEDRKNSIEMKHETHLQAYDNAVYQEPVDEKVSPSDGTPSEHSADPEQIQVVKL